MSFNTILGPTQTSNSDSDFAFLPAVTNLSNGSFAVTYEVDDHFDATQIVSQVFNAQGELVQGTFAKPLPHLTEFDSDIAGLSGGGFAMVWTEMVFDTTGTFGVLQVFTAVYDNAGNQLSIPVGVDTDPTLDNAQLPQVSALSNGGYVATWLIRDSVQGSSDLMAAVYNSAGQQVVAPIDVTHSPGVTDTTNFLTTSIAPLANGGFALTWTTQNSDFDFDVYTAIYNAQGQQVLAPFNITHTTAILEINPQIAVLSNGNYALTWDGDTDPTGFAQLATYTAVFDAQGNQIAAPSVVGSGQIARIGALTNGDYAVMWYDGLNVLTAVYDGEGHQLVAPITVSSAPGAFNYAVGSITSLSNGAYAVTWHAQIADGTYDIFTAVYDSHGHELVAPVNVSNSPGVDDTFETVDAHAQSNGSYAITWQGPGSSPFSPTEYLAIFQFVSDQDVAKVSVVGSADINLDLSAVISVGGDVAIGDNDNLVTLDLHNLVSVGGNFEISNNGALLTLTLPNLVSVGGIIDVSHNAISGSIDIGGLVASGVIDISANATGGSLDLGSIDGSGVINVNENATGGNLDIESMTGAGVVNANDNVVSGDLDIGSISGAGVINVSENATGGNLDIGSISDAGVINVGANAVGGTLDLGSIDDATIINVNDNLVGSGTLDLSGLTAAGDMSVSGNVVITIDLSALIAAGAIIIANNGVVTLNLSALVSVGADVSISANHSLLTVDMPELTHVAGAVSIGGNTAAGSVDLGSLISAGSVEISNNASATTIGLGSLTTVTGSVSLENNSAAGSVDLGSLESAGGAVSIGGNTAAGSVDLGSLTSAGSVDISGNDSATVIDLGSLTTVTGSVEIDLSEDATVDASALGPRGGTVHVIGDDAHESDVILGSLANMQGLLTLTTADGVVLTSEAGFAQITLTGTDADNTLIGSVTTRNVILTGGGHDIATGGSDDDLIIGGAGNDTLDGRNGVDTTAYSGNLADYGIVRHADESMTVTDNRAGSPDGTDTLSNFELFQFVDGIRTLGEVLPSPVITSNGGGDAAQASIAENTAVVTQVAAINPNAVQNLQFAIAGGVDAAKFQIDQTTGALSFIAAPDFEHPTDAGGNNVYDLLVQVSDGFHFDTQALAVRISNVNEAPGVSPLTRSVGEDGPSFIQDLLAGTSDPDSGAQLTASGLDATVTTAGGRILALGADYTLNGATLALTAQGFVKFNPLSGSQMDQAVFHFGVSDGLITTPNALTLTVTGANDAPTLVNQTANQSATAGTPFTLTLPANTFQDPDSGDHLGLGATLNNSNPLPTWLNFNPATGAFGGTPGTGDAGGFDVKVTATDAGGLTASDVFHVSVSAPSLNHAPVITSDQGGATASVIITDDTRHVATVHAIDPDPGATVTYSIAGGADQKLFAIDPKTGALTFKTTPQDGHSYQVTVAASDGSMQDTQAIKVQVANGPFESGNLGIADTFAFKPHFGLAVVSNFDATSANHDALELDQTLFRNADPSASPAAVFDLMQHHSFQLGPDVVIITDTLDIIDLRNTSLHNMTPSDFFLV